MYTNMRRLEKDFQPAAIGSTETKSLFAVKKGWRVLSATMETLISAAGGATSTLGLRVNAAAGGAANGLMAATNTVITAGTLTPGAGADLANSGGFLCTADGAIDITYTFASPGATNPKCKIVVNVMRDIPGSL